MKIEAWIIALVWPLALSWAMPTDSLENSQINELNNHCEIDDTYLTCDFSGASNQTALLESVPTNFRNVHVKNVNKLLLKEDICVDLYLGDIPEVTVLEGKSVDCGSGLELSAKNVTFDRLPRQITGFYFKGTRVSSFSTDASLTQFAVVNSHIKTLKISSPLGKKVIASFTNTTIDYFEKLITEEGSTLILQNTTIHNVASEGFIAKGGTVNIRNSNIPKGANSSIIIHQNVVLNIDKYLPILTKMSLPDSTERKAYTSLLIAFICILAIIIIILIVGFALHSKGIFQNILTRFQQNSQLSGASPNGNVDNQSDQCSIRKHSVSPDTVVKGPEALPLLESEESENVTYRNETATQSLSEANYISKQINLPQCNKSENTSFAEEEKTKESSSCKEDMEIDNNEEVIQFSNTKLEERSSKEDTEDVVEEEPKETNDKERTDLEKRFSVLEMVKNIEKSNNNVS